MTAPRIQYQAKFPKSSSWFGNYDTEVENIWKRQVPLDPVVRDDDVVSSQFLAERPDEDGIRIGVDTAVLEHDIGSPHIADMRRASHCLPEDLAHSVSSQLYTASGKSAPYNFCQ